MTATTYGENTRRLFLAVEAAPSDTGLRMILADAVEEDTGDGWLGAAVRATADRWPKWFDKETWGWALIHSSLTGSQFAIRLAVFEKLTGRCSAMWPSWRDYPTPFAALCDLWGAWAETHREG
jgi:hypothetical protein